MYYLLKNINKFIIFFIIVYILIITICKLLLNKQIDYFFNKTNNIISICIPLIPRDIDKISNLIKSINKQTLLPDEIIISLSGYNENNDLQLENKFKHLSIKPLKLIINNDTKYAGENRNIASSYANGNIIVFMDADDIFTYDAIEKIDYIFKKYNPLSFIHNYEIFYNLNDIDNLLNKKQTNLKHRLVFGDELYNIAENSNTLFLPHFNNNDKIHHGHLTINKEILKNIKQNNNLKRGQDSDYVRNILNTFGAKKNTMIYTNDILSYYYIRT